MEWVGGRVKREGWETRAIEGGGESRFGGSTTVSYDSTLTDKNISSTFCVCVCTAREVWNKQDAHVQQ